MTSQPAAEGQEWRIEELAAAVHQAYLDTCSRLGWPVKLENQVPYEELAEDSKELDRASVRAVLYSPQVLAALNTQAQAEGWRSMARQIERWVLTAMNAADPSLAHQTILELVRQAALDAPRTEGPANIAGEGEIP